MLDLALLVLLGIGFLIGVRRGLILQLIHMTGFIVAFVTAYIYYDDIAPKLVLWVPFPQLDEANSLNMLVEAANLDAAYYNAIAFAAIFFAVKILMQLIGSMLDFLAQFPLLKQFNSLLGGFLGFVEVYIIAFIALFIMALLPIEYIQTLLEQSVLGEMMVKHTPILSGTLEEWWIQTTPVENETQI
ncbi:membrane protein [Bacillus coahuilensis p1.1.43]|uniref:Membrane protein n=1 Tax=Bacillus coahuilensis p1.1.43 TaxID=1150625 RepID=A0A147K6R1_9BACI|nr:CvpA family protein [Bacillus coahuilensis]KUP05754.1 membrane protein [Bacillus coahuilensis p1.1.43]